MSQQQVPHRTWGKTGLSIPVIPFGTQGFGDKFGPVTDEEACALIRHAVDRGVNHFDCARCYGNSVRKLGVAIKQGVVQRDEIIISGRLCCHSGAEWGGYGEGRADYSKTRVLADIEDQLNILGIENSTSSSTIPTKSNRRSSSTAPSRVSKKRGTGDGSISSVTACVPTIFTSQSSNQAEPTRSSLSTTSTCCARPPPRTSFPPRPKRGWGSSTAGRSCGAGSRESPSTASSPAKVE